MAKKNKRTRGPTQRVEPLVGRVVGLVRNGFGCPSGLWVFPKSSDKQILFRDGPQRIGSFRSLANTRHLRKNSVMVFQKYPAFEFTWCGSAPNLHHPSDTQPLIGYTMLYSNILGYTNWFIGDHCSLFHWDTADTYWPTSLVGWHVF